MLAAVYARSVIITPTRRDSQHAKKNGGGGGGSVDISGGWGFQEQDEHIVAAFVRTHGSSFPFFVVVGTFCTSQAFEQSNGGGARSCRTREDTRFTLAFTALFLFFCFGASSRVASSVSCRGEACCGFRTLHRLLLLWGQKRAGMCVALRSGVHKYAEQLQGNPRADKDYELDPIKRDRLVSRSPHRRPTAN